MLEFYDSIVSKRELVLSDLEECVEVYQSWQMTKPVAITTDEFGNVVWHRDEIEAFLECCHDLVPEGLLRRIRETDDNLKINLELTKDRLSDDLRFIRPAYLPAQQYWWHPELKPLAVPTWE